MPTQPFAIYYEHPDWFRPLFAELDRRGIKYVALDPRASAYDPAMMCTGFSLLFNRMSPSAYTRGGVQGMFYTAGLLELYERLGTPVVNGSKGFGYEISKARQLQLLVSLGLLYPKARVINHASRAVEATESLRFPVVVKANIGGANQVELGVDYTALVQEYVPARGGHITRVETLGGKFLYAIKVYTTGDSFNLCPADICQRADGVELVRSACPIDAPKTGLKVEGYTPPPEVIEACEKIMQTAGIDVGGIEYMIDDRNGSLLYYDINALSNFVADAKNVVGFDPFVKLVDYLEARAERRV